MSQVPSSVRSPEEVESGREKSRQRAAAVRHEIRLANDALAAADLLLGLNFSIGAMGREQGK